ncbi:hypothetical protein F7731_14575 [Cytobacillus depressus]|uniref:Lipoprotein n=1 Tax=Cytobacillus depressus TaxID=1602942 RepID=A0A6L3V5I3_9BACI|nr:hypothetical protein [Cytobacillus depressus]KAB2334437.1 hypothetical protein F7731_14575 [Cytobacillus depressus]
MKKIITLLLTIILLTACSETTKYDYKFSGESEHWEAEFSYKGTEKWIKKDGINTYSNEDNYELVLKYKGSLEELSSLQNLEYSYNTNSSGGGETKNFTEPPSTVIFSSSGASKSGAKVSEDEIIKVNVKWDDFNESFELHNKSK